MDMHLLLTQRRELFTQFENAERLITQNERFSRACKEIGCSYCPRLDLVKRTYNGTRVLLTHMIEGIGPETLPRTFFPKRLTPGIGKYQAYILRNGIYLNVWALKGHSNARELLCKEGDYGAIKVHARMCSEIQFSHREEPPTEAQIDVVKEMILDSEEPLWFTFKYDINHPDPDVPF